MISVIFYKNFEKKYKKLGKPTQEIIKKKLSIFKQDTFNPILNNHPLDGKYRGYRSINITGDVRAVYRLKTNYIAIFVTVDNHSNLYK